MIKRGKFKSAFEAVKPLVLKRDQNRCIKCRSDLSIEIHHVEGYKTNDLDLLATLCYLCHGIAPMGKSKFSDWIASGATGLEVLQHNLAQRGINLDLETITAFCSALHEMSVDMGVSKFRKARDHMRLSGFRCEGQKPFGEKPGEPEILQSMRALRISGFSNDKIAAALNANGVLTRKGKAWRGDTLNKILNREGITSGIPREPKEKF